uniref:ParB/Sulfiredoxin domain-containing protein n=1 Tax=Plectus sambesii TaxID=2011161 RepID=A0A914WZ62_9BILA
MAADNVNKLPPLTADYEIVQGYDEDNYESWREKKYYHRRMLVYVPLSTISFKNWENSRYERLLDGIPKRGCTPIMLGTIENGKWTLVDGNHRCCALEQFGYSVVPAIIETECYECPVSREMAEFYDDKFTAEKLLSELKQRGKERIVTASVDPSDDPSCMSLLLNLHYREPETVIVEIPREHLNGLSPCSVKIRMQQTLTGEIIIGEQIYHLQSITVQNLMNAIEEFEAANRRI